MDIATVLRNAAMSNNARSFNKRASEIYMQSLPKAMYWFAHAHIETTNSALLSLWYNIHHIMVFKIHSVWYLHLSALILCEGTPEKRCDETWNHDTIMNNWCYTPRLRELNVPNCIFDHPGKLMTYNTVIIFNVEIIYDPSSFVISLS